MPPEPDFRDAREKALDAAEILFAQHGYASVKLRDIAAELGVSHASLYHHFPAGKEALFIEVTERNLRRHGAAMKEAAAESARGVRPRLYAMIRWLFSQPPIDLTRMARTDMPALPAEIARRLMDLAHASLIVTIKCVLEAGVADGELASRDMGLMAGGVLGLVESVHAVPDFAVGEGRYGLACELVDVLLAGLGYGTDRKRGRLRAAARAED